MLTRRLRLLKHRPPSQNVGIYPTRRFHASRPHRSEILTEAITLSHNFFQTVHSTTGLSWPLSILLTAGLTRIAWVPVQWVSNINAQRRNAANPLLVAWRTVYRHRAAIRFPQQTRASAILAESWVQRSLKERYQIIRRTHGIQSRWYDFGRAVAFIPVWLLNADVIRRMAGNETSIFGTLTLSRPIFSSQPASESSSYAKVPITDISSIETSSPEASSIDLPSQPLLDGSPVAESSGPVIPLEPGFSEGFLHIPSLLATDPFWLLPLAFAGLQFVSIYSAIGGRQGLTKAKVEADLLPQGQARLLKKAQVQLMEFMLAAPFLFAFVLIRNETQTAVLLYLVGSAGTQAVLRPTMKWIMGRNEKKAIAQAVPKGVKLKTGPTIKLPSEGGSLTG